jgi:hypothetical protein
MLMEEEAAAVAAAAPRPDTGGPTLPGWVAEGRSVVARRGTEEFRHLLEPGRAWKVSARTRYSGLVTVQR